MLFYLIIAAYICHLSYGRCILVFYQLEMHIAIQKLQDMDGVGSGNQILSAKCLWPCT